MIGSRWPWRGVRATDHTGGGQLGGIPHTPGTREYLTCESGRIELVASGERWELGPGDALVFRGDQRHSYANRGDTVAIAYSLVLPGGAG